MNIRSFLVVTLFTLIASISYLNAAQSVRSLPSFSKIKVVQGIEVVYTQDAEQQVVVVSKDVLKNEKVITSVNEGVLEISLCENHNLVTSDRIMVYVSSPVLEEIYTMNHASFKAKSLKNIDRLRIIQAKDSYVNIGELQVDNELELILSGKSRFDSKSLSAENLKLAMRSKSHADFNKIDVLGDIWIKSNGKSFASLGGEAHDIFIEKSCCTSIDVRNLTYDNISTSEINII